MLLRSVSRWDCCPRKLSGGSGKFWAHPAISDGRLYIRRGETMMAYDIKAAPQNTGGALEKP